MKVFLAMMTLVPLLLLRTNVYPTRGMSSFMHKMHNEDGKWGIMKEDPS